MAAKMVEYVPVNPHLPQSANGGLEEGSYARGVGEGSLWRFQNLCRSFPNGC
jgi:hypothetical protein